MDWKKRSFDIAAALFLITILWPLIAVVAVAILLRDGRPVLYKAERMRGVDQPFFLLKFRTMTVVAQDSGVSGKDKEDRITALGRTLRARRLDELPQLWNVLTGDISFVGPRPPLRSYVERFPEVYAEVLKSRPGITGLATLVYHKTEERLLSGCETREDTDRIYARRCVPRKARLDLLYAKNRHLCWDIWLMFATVFRKMTIRGRRRL
ncbi:sugar transferase [Primorskyibacter sp. S187A]|uniref:sugar transferase n=1 Tax=Primorskyibacter sp. S187A TaxID=3415130 RepID=UPI003C7CF7CD